MGKPIDANGTQAELTWSQINWQKVEKTVLRLQHRIFMAKVKGDANPLGARVATNHASDSVGCNIPNAN